MRLQGWEIVIGSIGIIILGAGILTVMLGHGPIGGETRGMIAGGSAITLMTFVVAMVSRMD